MGIYDRDYYHSTRGRFIDSIGRTGQVCKWLILINVGIFVLQVLSKPHGRSLGPITDALILDTQLVFSGQVWRLLTYAFLHDPESLWHILFNMLFLWWFGNELESIYGHKEFLAFYLVSALLGGIGFTLFSGWLSFQAAGNVAATRYCLGASGAVTAVMLVFACHFPTRTILLFFILPVPIWALVAFQVLQDLLIFASQTATRTAVEVHLCGALFGFLYYKYNWRLTPFLSNWNIQLHRRSRPKLRVYHGEDVLREVELPGRAPVDEQLEAKLDAVLAKIQTSGKESLSASERDLLLRASEIYRKRREEV